MARMTFDITAGRMARRDVHRMVRYMAARADVDLTWDEDRGWLSSQFIYTARGNNDAVKLFEDLYRAWTSSEADGDGERAPRRR